MVEDQQNRTASSEIQSKAGEQIESSSAELPRNRAEELVLSPEEDEALDRVWDQLEAEGVLDVDDSDDW